jgi:hypothetical protein
MRLVCDGCSARYSVVAGTQHGPCEHADLQRMAVPTGFAEPAVLLPVARGPTHDRRLVMALVAALVSGYAEPCCAALRANADTLDRTQLAAGIATIDVRGCTGHGAVKLSLAIAPAGTVTSVTIRSSTDDALATCIVAAARKGTFAKTQRGGAFSYTWRL